MLPMLDPVASIVDNKGTKCLAAALLLTQAITKETIFLVTW